MSKLVRKHQDQDSILRDRCYFNQAVSLSTSIQSIKNLCFKVQAQELMKVNLKEIQSTEDNRQPLSQKQALNKVDCQLKLLQVQDLEVIKTTNLSFNTVHLRLILIKVQNGVGMLTKHQVPLAIWFKIQLPFLCKNQFPLTNLQGTMIS